MGFRKYRGISTEAVHPKSPSGPVASAFFHLLLKSLCQFKRFYCNLMKKDNLITIHQNTQKDLLIFDHYFCPIARGFYQKTDKKSNVVIAK